MYKWYKAKRGNTYENTLLIDRKEFKLTKDSYKFKFLFSLTKFGYLSIILTMFSDWKTQV